MNRIEGICERYNSEIQNGKYLPGISPAQGFEQFFGDVPVMKLPSECRHLLASEKRLLKVGRNGITFMVGSERFTYKNEATGRVIGQNVYGWFNPEDPRFLSVTDLNNENVFTVERATLVPAMDAPREILEKALRENAAHDAPRKDLYRVVRSRFSSALTSRMFMRNVVDQSTRELGESIQSGLSTARAQKELRQKRVSKVLRLADRTGIVLSPSDSRFEQKAEGAAELSELLGRDRGTPIRRGVENE